MASSTNHLLNVVQAVSTAVSRLLPVVEHLPDSFSKWVPPIKKAVAEHQKLSSQMGVAAGAAKALRGRFNLVDAAMAALNLRTLGASKRMSILGAAGAMAAAKIVRGFKNARKEAENLERAGGKGSGAGGFDPRRLLIVAAAFRATASARAAFLKPFSTAGGLNDRGDKAGGVDPGNLMVLDEAAKAAGIEDLTGSMVKLQNTLVDAVRDGASPAARTLSLLGLKAERLAGDLPTTQLRTVGEALMKIENPAIRANAALDLFGRSGAELLPLFKDSGAIDEAAAAVGRQAQILSTNAAIFDRVGDRLDRSGLKLQGFFVGAASRLAPLLDVITEKFDKVDMAAQGEKFADAILKAKTNAEEMVGIFQRINDKFSVTARLGGFGKVVSTWAGVAKVGLQKLAGPEKSKAAASEEAGATMMDEITVSAKPDWWARDPLISRSRLNTPTSGLMASNLAGTAATFREKFNDPNFIGPLPPMLSKGGIVSERSSLNAPAKSTRPLLSLAERRAFDDVRVSQGGTRTASTSGAFGAVRAGDAERKQNAAKEKERERLRNENSVARSNELLAGIAETSKRTAEAMEGGPEK